jgi:hypothetical protein
MTPQKDSIKFHFSQLGTKRSAQAQDCIILQAITYPKLEAVNPLHSVSLRWVRSAHQN